MKSAFGTELTPEAIPEPFRVVYRYIADIIVRPTVPIQVRNASFFTILCCLIVHGTGLAGATTGRIERRPLAPRCC